MILIHVLGGLKSIPHSSLTSVYTFIMTPPPWISLKSLSCYDNNDKRKGIDLAKSLQIVPNIKSTRLSDK